MSGARYFSEEKPLNANKWIRQVHRWLSIAFTVAVIVTFVALTQEQPVVWVSYMPLLPLGLLLLTGLYLFVLPYVTQWRSGRRTVAVSE
jgi:cellulose synthase/poly-beta-1,6-N-acetylglucosamine synthase-like glycosyltransferase